METKVSKLVFLDGKLMVSAEVTATVDSDKDGKASAKFSSQNQLEIDAYEAVTEIAKKDIAWLEGIIKDIKIGQAAPVVG